jgi:hypothetical protein
MLFINRNKPDHHNAVTTAPAVNAPPVPIAATKMQICDAASMEEKIIESKEDNKENNNSNKQQQVVSQDAKAVVKKDMSLSSALSRKKPIDTRKRKHVTSSDRRGTLSPNSARAMALSACEENTIHSTKSMSSKTKQTLSSTTHRQHKKDVLPIPPSHPASSSSLSRKTTVNRRRETISTDLFTITDEEIDLINRNSQSPSEEKKSVTPSNDDIISSSTPVDDSSAFNSSVMEEVPLISLDDEIQLGLLPSTLPLNDMEQSIWSLDPPLLSPLKPITTPLKPISTKKIPLKSPLQVLSQHLNDSVIDKCASSPSGISSLYPPVPPLSTSKNIISEKIFTIDEMSLPAGVSNEPVVIGNDAIDELDFLSMLTSNSTRSYSEETGNAYSFSSSDEMKQWEEMKAMEDSESSVEMVVETPVSSGSNCLEDSSKSSLASVDDFIKTMTYYQQYYLSLPELIDENDSELMAKRRMHERFVIARNQFQWEKVSIQAANSAIVRAKMLYETK